jgi:peptidyl-prolyl cis-trans isomerase C
MKIIKTTLAAMFTGLIALQSSLAGDMSKYIPGFYTEWEVSPESGDVGGVEIFVFNGFAGPYVVYTLAEGQPGIPQLVEAQLDGKRLRFQVGETKYTCEFTPEGLKLNEGGDERMLKKGSLMNSKSAEKESTKPSDTAARVNGQDISQAELEVLFSAALESSGKTADSLTKEQKKNGYMQLLNDLIDQALLQQASADEEVSNEEIDAEVQKLKSQFSDEATFENDLLKNGLTMEKLQKNAQEEIAIRRWIASQIPQDTISEKQAKSYYDNNTQEFKHSALVKASHILFMCEPEASAEIIQEKKDAATKAWNRANAGEDFAALAKELSEEPGADKSEGDLGFFAKDRMVPEFAEAAFALETGATSEPVRTPFGWHVIRVIEKKKAGITPFSEAKGQIMEYLAAANQRKALEGILKKLKKSAKIEILISK